MERSDAKSEASLVAPTDREGRFALLQRAQAGDNQALPLLRAMFDDDEPRFVELFGNMAAHTEKALISGAAGKDLSVREGLERKLRNLREELAGSKPTAIERLLAERAAFCWLTLYEYERTYANSGSITLKQAEYHQHRIGAAHRRFLSSLKMLATIRKLALPSIQVNIGENQVNLASTV